MIWIEKKGKGEAKYYAFHSCT